MASSAWSPVRLPYRKSPLDLPFPLPTESDFMSSPEVYTDCRPHHVVVGVGVHFVVKYGFGMEEREGQTLLFLSDQMDGSPTIPKLYAMYRSPDHGFLCLIMERRKGVPLATVWHTLSATEKTHICSKARAILSSIRQLPPPGFYGSVDGGPIAHHLLWDAEHDKTIEGPFHSEQELNMGFVGKLRKIWNMNQKYSYKAEFYERQLDQVLQGHPAVFTHADIQRKNILVERTTAEDFEVSIVDWERAGWYPSYWEYAAMFAAFEWNDDWPSWFEQIVHPWIAEGAIIRMIFQDIFF